MKPFLPTGSSAPAGLGGLAAPALWFDRNGNGPSAVYLVFHHQEEPPGKGRPELGLRVFGAPMVAEHEHVIGGGFMFDRGSAVELANHLAAWLDVPGQPLDYVDHDDALHLATVKQQQSNLARCYLDLYARLEMLRAAMHSTAEKVAGDKFVAPLASDSMGRPLMVGDRIRFRGSEYTIKGFSEERDPHFGTRYIDVVETLLVGERPCEFSVDKVNL